jgi:hypothetical protein
MSLKTLTDLYVKGIEVVLTDNTLLWLQKMTPYEQGVVRQKAALARARSILALDEIGSEELALMDVQLRALSDADVVQAVLGSKYNEMYQEVVGAIAIDADWTDRELIRTSTVRADLVAGSADDLLIDKLEEEYAQELLDRLANAQASEKLRLESAGRESNLKAYRELYADGIGRTAFMAVYSSADLYFMARACMARKVDGRFDHDMCDHSKLIFESIDDLRSLPEELLATLRNAESAIAVSVQEARFLGSQASSSDSSAQPSEQADSGLSSPTDSPALAGTSR